MKRILIAVLAALLSLSVVASAAGAQIDGGGSGGGLSGARVGNY
jgi:hypothetical protein